MVKKVTPVKKAVKKKVAAKPAAPKKVVAKKAVNKVVKPVPVKAKKVVAKPAVTSKPKKSSVVKSTKKAVLKAVKTPKKKIAPAKPVKEIKKVTKVTKAIKEVAPKKVHVVERPKVVAPAPTPAPVVVKPKAPLKKYNKHELEHFKKIIVDKQREIIEQLQNLRDQMLDPTTGEYINENSPYSLHMAEQGTDAMEREKTYLYAQRENKFLGYLEDALKRIELGTYGLCIECIDDPKHLCPTCPLIPKERLEAVPHSQLCVQIKMKQEKPRRM